MLRAFVLVLCAVPLGCGPSPTDRDGDLDVRDVTPDVSAPDNLRPDVRPPLPARRFLTDLQGRAVILHGANVGSKDVPLHVPELTADDVHRMASTWGFTAVRYLVFWDAIEPSAGIIDQAYFDGIQQRLDWFAAQHIFVVLDMHQDVYARRFCCDGAPDWAIRDEGLPFEPQTIWSLNYLQPAVERAFDNFWAYADPNRDLQDHYGAAWVGLARRFHDHPAVLGFDLINEPSPGSQFDPLEAARGVAAGATSRSAVFDQTRLGPFYQRLIQRIRAVDTDHYLFVEPRFGAASNGAAQYLPALTDPRDGESRVVFAPHLYSVAYEASMRYDPSADRTVSRWETARSEETRTQDWPLLLGEFGMDQTFPGGAEYLDDVLGMADRMMISWTYWSWSPGPWGFWDPATRSERPNIDQLVRVYPQRVAGAPTHWSWDRVTHVFSLAFDTLPGVTGATEIFLPTARFFAGGYTVDVSDPAGTWTQSWDPTWQVLSITTNPARLSHTITIRPD